MTEYVAYYGKAQIIVSWENAGEIKIMTLAFVQYSTVNRVFAVFYSGYGRRIVL